MSRLHTVPLHFSLTYVQFLNLCFTDEETETEED